MPDLNFPSSPSLNDIYSFGNKTWVWNGTAWQIQSSGAINGLPIGNSSPSTGAFTTLSASGNTTISGTTVLSGTVASNIVPAANVTYDLGSPSQQWRTLYVSGNTIFIGDSTITSNATSVTLTNPSGAAFSVTGNSPANAIGSFGSVNASGNISASGNVISGNITTIGLVSATGNITGNYILGNGSQLTGLPATYTDSNVTSLLSNLGANVISSSGNITTTANISGGYLLGNGSQITGLPPGYSNTDVATYLASGTNSSNIVTTGNVSATNLTGTLLTAAQNNITSVGTLTSLSVTGNVVGGNIVSSGAISTTGTGIFGAGLSVVGNINATGNINYENVTDLVVGDPLIYLGANNTSNMVDLGFVASYNNGTYYHTGLARNYSNGVWTFFDGVVAEPTTVIDWANATYPTVKTGALTSTASVSAAGNITGNFFFGNAAYMTGIPVSYSNTDVANYLASGTDTSNIITTANVQGAYVIGNGSALTSITGANVTGQVPNALVAGTVYTNAQPNITSVGTLSSVTVSGNVVSGNINTNGQISAAGNVTGNYFVGNGSQLTGINGGVTFTSQANTPPATPNNGDFWYNTFTDVKYQYINDGDSSQWVDQSVPTSYESLTTVTLNATGNITGGNLSVSTGTITAGNIVNANANGVGNIGNATTYFNTVFAKATSAQYADLAEYYRSDYEYEPGTVVVFGGVEEVTISTTDHDTRVAGVVSTAPAYIMNSACPGVPVALTGRVPCKVQGPVAKGDVLVTGSLPGTAQRIAMNYKPGSVLGKSLAEIADGSVAVIEVVVGRF